MQRNSHYECRRLQIFAITWLAYAGFYLTRKSFSVAKVGMEEDASVTITSTQMAWIDFGYLVAYAVGQFVWGMSGDRFGTRRIILTGMFGSIAAGFAMGVSSIVLVLGVFFILQGLCQSTGWAPLSKNFGQFFSQRERGWTMGLWCTNYAVGGFAASWFAGYCGERWGYQYAFFGPATALLVIWLLFILFQRNKPEDFGLPPIEEYHGEPKAVIDEDDRPEDEPEGSWVVVKEVLVNPMILRLGAVYFFLKPTRYAVIFWGPAYVGTKLSTGMQDSGTLSGLFDIAGPISVLAGGLVSDKVFGSRRMPIAVTCLFALAVLMLFMQGIPATKLAVGIAFFLIGLLVYAPDSLISGTAAVDFGTKKGASTAAGFVNGCGSVGAIIGGTLPGFIKDEYGWGPVFYVLAGSLFMAGLLLAPKWNELPPVAEQTEPAG